MEDRFKFRYVFEKDFGGKIGIRYKMPVFNLDDAVRSVFENKIIEYTNFDYKLIAKNQCTGLKDKNEKVIYEGDIVKYTSKKSKTNPEKAPYTKNYKVVWQEKYTGYNLQSKEKVNCFNLGIMTDDIEVVGNIYENKELLEDTDER